MANVTVVADLAPLERLIPLLESLEQKVDNLEFITVEGLAEEMGCSIPTAQAIFNRPDFPCCDYAKSKVAEKSAVKKYFSVPRRKK